MGVQDVQQGFGKEDKRAFMKNLLADLRALEKILDKDMIESDLRRIGAEQELFLVDDALRPSPNAQMIMEKINDHRVTTELAKFNLEFNLDPLIYKGNCLSELEKDLNSMLTKIRAAAKSCGSQVVLTGILPTLKKVDLDLRFMTPKPRYAMLNQAMNQLRGGTAFQLRLTGTDELRTTHESIMLESCNTSFQVHFQTCAKEFARLYNASQAVAGPILAAAANSPLLFGKRLWKETRIALFQQAVDTRTTTNMVQDRKARVSFGDRWVDKSVVEIFREDIARMRVLLGERIDEDPFTDLKNGIVPKLSTLQMHNGTVYRWTRPCYGVTNGKPHLRIENRILPSGPTVVDEVANAAMWLGLVSGLSITYGDVSKIMDFDVAKTNFTTAARHGLESHFTWLDGNTYPATDLFKQELLPLAKFGLQESRISNKDIDKYLNIIDERVSSAQNGATWLLNSFSYLKNHTKEGEMLSSLVSTTIENQIEGSPVHMWKCAETKDEQDWHISYAHVDQFMTSDVFTVNEDELVNLVACLMDWAHIRHVPVEDDDGNLAGLVSYRSLLRILGRDEPGKHSELVPVKEIMQSNPVTIPPDTRTIDAIKLMKEQGISCLPVVEDKKLVGIVTERDFLEVVAQLLEDKLHNM